jgi:hypothetical protein
LQLGRQEELTTGSFGVVCICFGVQSVNLCDFDKSIFSNSSPTNSYIFWETEGSCYMQGYLRTLQVTLIIVSGQLTFPGHPSSKLTSNSLISPTTKSEIIKSRLPFVQLLAIKVFKIDAKELANFTEKSPVVRP